MTYIMGLTFFRKAAQRDTLLFKVCGTVYSFDSIIDTIFVELIIRCIALEQYI